MESLLSTGPHPGPNTFLLDNDDTHSMQHHRYDSNRHLTSFLSCEEGGVSLLETSAADKLPCTFLQKHEQTPLAAGASDSSTIPRTIANDSLLSTVSLINETIPVSTQPSTQQPSSPRPDTEKSPVATAYTTAIEQTSTPPHSMPDKPTKAIPPHLKRRMNSETSALTQHKHTESKGTNAELVGKLSELGVRVSAPKPAPSCVSNPWEKNTNTPNPAASSNTNPWTSDPAQPVPGNTWDDSPAQPAQSFTSNPWEKKAHVASEDAPSYTGRGSTNQRGRGGGRGRSRGRGGGSSQTDRWLKNKDIPKPDPKKHETNWNWQHEQEYSFASSFGSEWDEAKQNGGGLQLGDWSNSFAPAPLEWESRSAFRAGQSEKHIQDWVDSIGKGVDVSIRDFETVEGVTYTFGSSDGTVPDNANTVYEVMGDMVPHYWSPSIIEEQAPGVFWQKHIRSNEPPPDDGIDLTDVKPWWDLIVRGGGFLRAPSQPPCKGIHPGQENEEQRIHRECDLGSWEASKRETRQQVAKQIAKQEKRRKKEENLKKLSMRPIQRPSPADLDSRFRPQTDFKLLIRPAQETDMRDVRDIYNWYVDNSCVVPELDRVSIEDMLERLQEIRACKLPFLVACEPGGPIKGRRARGKQRRNDDDEPFIQPDRIVGFALADDYNCSRGIYRFTAEIEIYIKYDTLGKNIGKCLMDKLMAMLDPGYLERGNYPISEELQNATPNRLIKTIVLNLPYDNRDRFEWKAKWLQNWLDFKFEADMEEMGNKSGKPVNLAIFKRTTAAELNHAAPPVISPLRGWSP